MSINDASPSDWDKVAGTGHPTFEEYMNRLNFNWVYDSTIGTDPTIAAEAPEFEDCWYPTRQKTGLEAWMKEAHEDVDTKEEDVVNNPSHYNTGSIECIEAISESMTSESFKGYLKGNALKYIWRCDYKGKKIEDLQKAVWYLQKLMQEEAFSVIDETFDDE
jgi:hypothetical protein|tara:strand:+ start:267 stop:752 length:486 start_codon:yes stop_codon:yes gene_type:complete